MKKQKQVNGVRKVHIALPEITHQRLRIKCAIEDMTIQEFIARLVETAVKDVQTEQLTGRN